MRLGKAAALIGVAAVALVACTTNGETGNPTAATTTSGSAKTTTPAPASERPKEIKLNGLDACKALTAENQKQLGTTVVRSRTGELVEGATGVACSYLTGPGIQPAFSYNIELVTNKGIDYWKGQGNLDVSPTKVAGFPAKQVTFKGGTSVECSVSVDVADDQQLFMQFLPIGREVSQDQMCQNAAKGAELALATLPTLK
ncbi:DUF3558 domain-containing protein [Actinosynnema sp. CA-248983]